jgi:hypothetical protein
VQDLVFVALSLVFFAVSVGYVKVLESLITDH